MSSSSKAAGDALYLGLDSSTQSLTAVLIDGSFEIVAEASVNFDRDLPEFGTRGGAHRGADGLTVTSPPIMWIAALDRLLEGARTAGWPLSRVAAVAGSGQQHGSVWLGRGAGAVLARLDARRTLREQLAGIFAVPDSPIWMDSSTGAECRALEAALGGAQAVADLTGSRAYERFTGNQIARIRRLNPAAYAATERIALVSSFMASVFAGRHAPIDWSDGSGMNLLDIRARRWAPAALDACGPDLAAKLGEPCPSHAEVGPIHSYFVQRHGFAADCRVIAFSGDNPNSLAGLMIRNVSDVAISLGTSDTVFGSLREPAPSASEGHIFVNPVDPDAYMALVCYKNGSLTREYVRDLVGAGDWAGFNERVAKVPPGNRGNIGFYIREPEITPPILKTGVFRFNARDEAVTSFADGDDTRAVLEGQFLSMRLHCGRIGIRPATILATGGASADRGVLRVMADVFGVPVCLGKRPGSAALGAAYRALHGRECAARGGFVPFGEVMAGAPAPVRSVEPDRAAHVVYSGMLGRYERLERRVIG